MSDLQAEASGEYAFLDSGRDMRLERFGPCIFSRPAPQALWRPGAPDLWADADAVFERTSAGGGHWAWRRPAPKSWDIRVGPCVFQIKPTSFGHVGLFPEHACHWPWVRERISGAGRAVSVLHLFAYTGAMSLIAARAGAEVCHVDAVRDINEWARYNARASGLGDAPIRWITDDVLKFCLREQRRGRAYDGIILDPPSYGKGPGGEKWILEEGLLPLLDCLLALTAVRPRFVLLTCHTPGFSPPVLSNLVQPWRARFGGRVEAGHMVLAAPSAPVVLPAGAYARWAADDE